MAEHAIDFVVIGNIDISKCAKLPYIVDNLEANLYIFCGGLGECLDSLNFVKKGFAVPNIYDDDHVIKVLKEKNLFISGRWTKINSVCLAGIDAKNPIQSVDRIYSSAPQECSLYVIVSTYPLSISKCSKVLYRGKIYLIGLPRDLSTKIIKLINTLGLIIACQENSTEVCIDRADGNVLYLSIPKSVSVVKVKLDIQNRSIVYIDVLS
ncbi:MAG: hypothetical protein QXL96_01390 [Ignisphaera sp.]